MSSSIEPKDSEIPAAELERIHDNAMSYAYGNPETEGDVSWSQSARSYEAGATAELSRHLSSLQPGGVRWVKASERLPKVGTDLFFKIMHGGKLERACYGRFRADDWGYNFDSVQGSFAIDRFVDDIIWLDESPAPTVETGGLKDIFETLKKLSAKYCVIHGCGRIRKMNSGRLMFDGNDLGYAVIAGCFDEGLIQAAIDEYEPSIENEGYYDFVSLLSHSPAQVGNYPPPNIEVEEYMIIEIMEFLSGPMPEDSESYTSPAPPAIAIEQEKKDKL